MIGGQVANGGDAVGQRVAGARTLLLESCLEPVCAELESILGLDAVGIASEVGDEGVEGGHGGWGKRRDGGDAQPGIYTLSGSCGHKTRATEVVGLWRDEDVGSMAAMHLAVVATPKGR